MRRLLRLWPTAAVVVPFVLAYMQLGAHDRLAVARAEAAKARDSVTVALKEAAAAQVAAQQARAAAARADTARHAAEQRAAAAEQHATVLRSAYNTALQTAPDTCKPVIDAANALLTAKDSVIAALHVAAQADSVERAHLIVALDTTQAALSRLQKPAAALVVADKHLAAASRRNFLLRLLPDVGAGATAGVDLTGKPNVTTGITLSWHF